MSIPKEPALDWDDEPHDRSVSHVDAAFSALRHIEIEPSREALESLLEKGVFTTEQVDIIGKWFDVAQKMIPIGLGHAVFADVRDIDTLKTIWKYRIKPTADALMESSVVQQDDFVKSYEAMVKRLEGGMGD